MMAWVWRILLFVAAAAAFAIALAPARVVLRPNPGGLDFSRVEGSIWNATLQDARIGELDAGETRLQTSALDLLRGALVTDASLAGRQVSGDVRLARGLGGGLEISSPSLTLTDIAISGWGGKGRTTLSGLRVAFAHGACRTAEGRLDSEALAQAFASGDQPGPSFTGEAACVGKSARLTLSGGRDGDALDAWLELDGDGTGRWRMTARTLRPRLMAALVAAGFQPQGEPGALVETGEFKWLAF